MQTTVAFFSSPLNRPSGNRRISRSELTSIVEESIRRAGGSPQVARSLAAATVASEADGQPDVGVAHLFDYLDAMREGRIDPRAIPVISRPLAAIHHSDAGGGIAQLGFDMAYAALMTLPLLIIFLIFQRYFIQGVASSGVKG